MCTFYAFCMSSQGHLCTNTDMDTKVFCFVVCCPICVMFVVVSITCTPNKPCVLQLQSTRITNTVFLLHEAARIRAVVCSSPCLLMLTLGFSAVCAHAHTPTPTHTILYLYLCEGTHWHSFAPTLTITAICLSPTFTLTLTKTQFLPNP